MKEMITTNTDVLVMLDVLLQEEKEFDWDAFYTDRNKKIPFFSDKPDENLAGYISNGYISKGSVLELGCGPGRNALFLAAEGFHVDAVDSSQEGIKWARERAGKKGLEVNFFLEDIFKFSKEEREYDFVYDSGCFHHIPPHRRMDYLTLVDSALKPGGCFALTTFMENGPLGGSSISDWEVYRQRSMRGGLGYSEEKLKSVFSRFEPIEIRDMRSIPAEESLFGVNGLRAALFRKPDKAPS
ncbi:class I SAM-dependent methyltransferase [Bacillus salacetis]|uniref:Class I SAM-dependent methyltransferase n=1 Tax=Bacillus salacetis TaxID=2315464 RepID=A0A3A1R4E2_9BACI|nr:class I SAM-dependent methyltransferase [Bacillus salacetis]RIW37424.1 class I SAM-dependent methyltransferase [Bacillus salacetis]